MNTEEVINLINQKDKPDTNQNHVKLLIHDSDYHPNKVTEKLLVEPHSIGVKGEHYEIGPPHNRIKKIHEYNFWSHEWKFSSNNFIGDIVEKYIHDFIIPNMPTLIKISEESDIQFSIVQYYYDGFNPGFHFNKSIVKVLSDLGASIDIDLYCISN